jgi:hypothetical protein
MSTREGGVCSGGPPLWSAKNYRRVPNSVHAAIGSRRYSWCRPPSTGLATTRWTARIRWPPADRARQSSDGSGMPGPRLACGTPAIVVRHPLRKDAPHVTLVQRDHEIKTLAPNRTDQPLAERVGLRRPHRRPEDRQSHRGNGAIHALRVNAVVIGHHESMRLIARDHHAELLRRPLTRRMVRHVPMQDPAHAHLQNHKDVKHAKARRYRHEEITREYRTRVITHEGAPRLRAWPALRSRPGRHVPPHGSRRDTNPELREQFRRNPLFAPRAIRGGHLRDQLLEVGWHARSALWPRFPPPEQAESLAMPANERLRLDHGEELTPINQPGQCDERQPRRVVGPPRLDLPLEVQRQLLAQEQILGGELRV